MVDDYEAVENVRIAYDFVLVKKDKALRHVDVVLRRQVVLQVVSDKTILEANKAV